jgi:hypothetical protein
MTQFKDREKGFEAKFAQEEEREFKALARRNKLLGLWAAEQMGYSGAAAEAYAQEVVKADFEEAGQEDVYRKVKGDLAAKGVDISEHRVRRKMDELLATARQQVAKEG